jgi:hypothetical protein
MRPACLRTILCDVYQISDLSILISCTTFLLLACLQDLMRRDIPAAEHICAIQQALTPVRMQLPTCSGTASIPPRASTRCSLTALLRFVIPYCEHLPNLDASSSSALANWSLSFSGIHKVKTFY